MPRRNLDYSAHLRRVLKGPGQLANARLLHFPFRFSWLLLLFLLIPLPPKQSHQDLVPNMFQYFICSGSSSVMAGLAIRWRLDSHKRMVCGRRAEGNKEEGQARCWGGGLRCSLSLSLSLYLALLLRLLLLSEEAPKRGRGGEILSLSLFSSSLLYVILFISVSLSVLLGAGLGLVRARSSPPVPRVVEEGAQLSIVNASKEGKASSGKMSKATREFPKSSPTVGSMWFFSFLFVLGSPRPLRHGKTSATRHKKGFPALIGLFGPALSLLL